MIFTDISEFKVNQFVISCFSKVVYKVVQINYRTVKNKMQPFESELLNTETDKIINATWYVNKCFELYKPENKTIVECSTK